MQKAYLLFLITTQRGAMLMVKCPSCGKEANSKGKEWNYRDLRVKFYGCDGCQKNFKAYFRDEKLVYTIPKVKN